MENIKIKEWYCMNYPSDELGKELKEDISFDDLFYCLDRGRDVYDFFGVGDSIIRERLFEKLSNLMKCDYDYIYDQWLRG